MFHSIDVFIIEFQQNNNQCLLGVIMQDILNSFSSSNGFPFSQVKDRASVPLILVSSAQQIQSLRNLFTSNNHFEFDSEKVHIKSRISFLFCIILFRYVVKFVTGVYLLLYPKLHILKFQIFFVERKGSYNLSFQIILHLEFYFTF